MVGAVSPIVRAVGLGDIDLHHGLLVEVASASGHRVVGDGRHGWDERGDGRHGWDERGLVIEFRDAEKKLGNRRIELDHLSPFSPSSNTLLHITPI